jgi:hypothetical protein
VLGWGPVYEPHRHPEGAEIGRRLPLRPGRYRLSVLGDPLAGSTPAVALRPDRPGAPARLSDTHPAAGGLEAEIEVREGEPAVGLWLRGGGAILLKGLRLSKAQPSRAGPV